MQRVTQLQLESTTLWILAEKAYNRAVDDKNQDQNVLFDSIRNLGEVGFLRSKFQEFYLIAVDCAEGDRWDRKQLYYEDNGLSYKDFQKDDNRDKNEEGVVYGQQVSMCVDEADYLIRNDNEPMGSAPMAIREKLLGKLKDPIEIFQGKLRPPGEKEAYMSIAYAASLRSNCIKRQVGAVIIDKNRAVISMGYNENSEPLKPCYEQFGECYREAYIEEVMAKFKACPLCTKELGSPLVFPYQCPHCNRSVYREIIKDRAMGRCTALHAEEKALLSAQHGDLSECTLYVTTFPCFTCSQKILNSGIQKLCFVESYPDLDSVQLLDAAKAKGSVIILDKFEGVKARAYFRLFSRWRSEKEGEILTRKNAIVKA
jgi:deoxycytidylate deaminase